MEAGEGSEGRLPLPMCPSACSRLLHPHGRSVNPGCLPHRLQRGKENTRCRRLWKAKQVTVSLSTLS